MATGIAGLNIGNINAPDLRTSIAALKGAGETLDKGFTTGVEAIDRFKKNVQALNDQKVLGALASVQDENQLNSLLGSGILDNANLSPEMQKTVLNLRNAVLRNESERARVNYQNTLANSVNKKLDIYSKAAAIERQNLLLDQKIKEANANNIGTVIDTRNALKQAELEKERLSNKGAAFKLGRAELQAQRADKNYEQGIRYNTAAESLVNNILGNPSVTSVEDAKNILGNTQLPEPVRQIAFDLLNKRIKRAGDKTFFGELSPESNKVVSALDYRKGLIERAGQVSTFDYLENRSRYFKPDTKDKPGKPGKPGESAADVVTKLSRSVPGIDKADLRKRLVSLIDMGAPQELAATVLELENGDETKARDLMGKILNVYRQRGGESIERNYRTGKLDELKSTVTRLGRTRSKLQRALSSATGSTKRKELTKRIKNIDAQLGRIRKQAVTIKPQKSVNDLKREINRLQKELKASRRVSGYSSKNRKKNVTLGSGKSTKGTSSPKAQ